MFIFWCIFNSLFLYIVVNNKTIQMMIWWGRLNKNHWSRQEVAEVLMGIDRMKLTKFTSLSFMIWLIRIIRRWAQVGILQVPWKQWTMSLFLQIRERVTTMRQVVWKMLEIVRILKWPQSLTFLFYVACYFNSLLQVLFFLPNIQEKILNHNPNEKFPDGLRAIDANEGIAHSEKVKVKASRALVGHM